MMGTDERVNEQARYGGGRSGIGRHKQCNQSTADVIDGV